MTEVWKPIPPELLRGITGYEASTEGSIKSTARIIVRGEGIRQPVRERILKPSLDKGGCPFVSFSGSVTRRVGPLILSTFVGPCPPGLECCHWDDDPLNNRIENLRWDTRSANRLDAIRNGKSRWTNHTHCPHRHELTEDNIIWHGPGKRWKRCKKCTQSRP
jgi:hypothetical protein